MAEWLRRETRIAALPKVSVISWALPALVQILLVSEFFCKMAVSQLSRDTVAVLQDSADMFLPSVILRLTCLVLVEAMFSLW